jgi:transposase-like protein
MSSALASFFASSSPKPVAEHDSDVDMADAEPAEEAIHAEEDDKQSDASDEEDENEADAEVDQPNPSPASDDENRSGSDSDGEEETRDAPAAAASTSGNNSDAESNLPSDFDEPAVQPADSTTVRHVWTKDETRQLVELMNSVEADVSIADMARQFGVTPKQVRAKMRLIKKNASKQPSSPKASEKTKTKKGHNAAPKTYASKDSDSESDYSMSDSVSSSDDDDADASMSESDQMPIRLQYGAAGVRPRKPTYDHSRMHTTRRKFRIANKVGIDPVRSIGGSSGGHLPKGAPQMYAKVSPIGRLRMDIKNNELDLLKSRVWIDTIPDEDGAEPDRRFMTSMNQQTRDLMRIAYQAILSEITCTAWQMEQHTCKGEPDKQCITEQSAKAALSVFRAPMV